MRIGVVGDPEGYYVRELVRAAGEGTTVLGWNDLAANEGTGSARFFAGGLDLGSFDSLLIRSMPAGSLEQVIFRMDVLGRLDAAGVVVLNPPRALETAIDKYLTGARLAEAGIPTPRTIVVQTAEQAMAAFETLNRDVVLKPLFGSEGRGLSRLTDPDVAYRAFRLLERLGSILYVQEFIAHPGYDVRILVIGHEAFAVRRRSADDWRTNVSRGAAVEAIEPEPEWLDLAHRAAEIVGAPFAGVDLVSDGSGAVYVLEVNAVPGWKGVVQAHGLDVAARVVRFAETCVQDRAARKTIAASHDGRRPDPEQVHASA